MNEFNQALEVASKAEAEYKAAHAEYIKAQPGRDLTVKQGIMHKCRLAYHAALERFFDEYERSKLL